MSYLNKALILKPSTISKKHWFLLNKYELAYTNDSLACTFKLTFSNSQSFQSASFLNCNTATLPGKSFHVGKESIISNLIHNKWIKSKF